MILNNTIDFYVPSTQGATKKISKHDFNARVREIENILAKLAGGFTTFEPVGGGWYSDELQTVIREKINIVSINVSDDALSAIAGEVHAMRQWYQSEWQQESVAVAINGALTV